MSQSGFFGTGGVGGSGIQTINTIGPDGGGNFDITSNDSSVTITPGTNSIDLSVIGGASGVVSINEVVITSSGTYTPSANLLYADIKAVGGGGGSGGVAATSGSAVFSSGAGGGGTAQGLFDAATIGASQAITIGAAGTAGPASGTFAGSAGGTTTVGSLLTATGGGGSAAAPGLAGTATGGQVNVSGDPGQARSNVAPGNGGGTLLGAGGIVSNSGAVNSGGPGKIYGGGAGGAYNPASSAAIVGAVGAQGAVVITEYIGSGSTPSVTPSFSAYVSSPINNVTGDGTAYNLIFDTELFDNGNNYDNTTGIFIAPKSGVYIFTVVVTLSGITIDQTNAFLNAVMSSGNTTQIFAAVNPFAVQSSGFYSMQGSVIVDLAMGEQFNLNVTVLGTTPLVGIYANGSPTFQTILAGSLLP